MVVVVVVVGAEGAEVEREGTPLRGEKLEAIEEAAGAASGGGETCEKDEEVGSPVEGSELRGRTEAADGSAASAAEEKGTGMVLLLVSLETDCNDTDCCAPSAASDSAAVAFASRASRSCSSCSRNCF